MRRMGLAFLTIAALALPAHAAPNTAMQGTFESLDFKARQIFQLWLIAVGATNAVPTEHFTGRTAKAIVQFQAENGYAPTGFLDKGQIDWLVAQADQKFNLWGMRRVTLPNHQAMIWVPFGLDLESKVNGSGYHYKDGAGRLSLDFVSLPDRTVAGVYAGLLGDRKRDGSTIHYGAFKDAEGWFVLSTTAPDGSDHYYRYHQDGDAVTGFALEWNNAVGNVNAERIAVIDSAVLGASMKGAFFIDPPGNAVARTEPPAPQPAARPVERAPQPPKKQGFTTGTGFFVSSEGHFVTNAHVVADCTKVMVKTDDGVVHEAARTATDTTNDLAILKLDGTPKRVPPLRLGTRLGEGVEAFGFPHSDTLATSGNFTLGNVTALSGVGDDSRYLQISAPVQAGNSGGPLLDGSGNLVGVVSAKLDAMKMAMNSGDLPQNVNFAVKSAILASFLDANRVEYKTGMAGKALEPADIADQARAMSGFVVCR